MNLFQMKAEQGEFGLQLTSEVFSVPVPGPLLGKLSPGKKVTLGVRPSDIRIAAKGEPGSFEARVDVVEYLGIEALINLRIGSQEFIAQVSAAERPIPDQSVSVLFNPAGLHFFDSESGQAY